jgi:subtilisin family serine protease
MAMERTRFRSALRSSLLIGYVLISPTLVAHAAGEPAVATSRAVENRIHSDGRARVIVRLRAPEPASAGQADAERDRQRVLDIGTRQQRIRNNLRGTDHRVRREFRSLPYIVVEVDAAALARLQAASGDVAQIAEDVLLAPTLADSIPQIEADLAHEQGYNGDGSLIAIIDTGVDNAHPFLAGKVIDEACFADRELPEDPGSCPNGDSEQFGPGAGAPCLFAESTCRHGTHVAGIAAGSGDTPGVAPAARLLSLQVFHQSTQCTLSETVPCARAFTSDITAALEYLYEQRAQYGNLASINMSLGSGPAAAPCDALQPAMADAINNLSAAGIATVISSGNSGIRNLIGFPACIDRAISVGAVDDDDNVASFSNVSPELDLFAPGVGIVSSVPGGDVASFSGTSMAAPHVAGAWAVMRQANPQATVDDTLATFVNSGRATRDGRSGGTVTRPRIRLGAALGIEAPLPVLFSLAPSSMRAGSSGSVSVIGTGFIRASVVRLNGAPRATTYVSDGELRVAITSADLMTPATSIAIDVVTPPPGGGTSATLPLLVTQASVSVDRTVADAGTPVTATLINGTGASNAWISLARVGTSEASFVSWTYIGVGNITFSWTVNMPTTAGTYEVRLFGFGGYTRTATSATITVPSPPPPPPPALAVDVTTANTGAPVTVTLSNGTGASSAWIALARVGDPNTSYLNWTSVGTGRTSFTWTVNMPGTAGSYEFRLFGNGGYTRTATSATIVVTSSSSPPEPPPPPPPPPPQPGTSALTVDVTTATAGAPVTVTLTNGTGASNAWIAFARVGAADTSYLNWTYVGTGRINFTWTVNMPGTAGVYEFRLFGSGGYTRTATSPAVTVTAPPPPPPSTLAVDSTAANPGAAVTVTLMNGTGASNAWISFARVSDANGSYLNWTYVGAGRTSFTWTVNMPSTAGAYEFRLFGNGGYTRTATSPTVQVMP